MPIPLFDRLTVDSSSASASRSRSTSPVPTDSRALIPSICRELTGLLNTRRATQDFDPSFDEAVNSLLTFGLVDFTSYNLTNEADQERVRYSMERAIRQFEPRLSSVTVSLDQIRENRPILQFHIEAILRTDRQREPISLSASLARDSRRISVSSSSI